MATEWTKVEPKLSDCVLKTIDELNFEGMTPVQASCIPLLLKNKDVAAEAVTGSGKTLAFLVPLLEIMQRRSEPWNKYEVGSIVISPTRELALQIGEVLDMFLKHMNPPYTKMLAIGGNSVNIDVENFRNNGANIIVATPGRLEDLLSQKQLINLPLAVKSLEFLVLDEADRLLDLGFEKTLNTILHYLPRQRRTGLFSATQTKEVELLLRAGLRNPVIVTVKEKSAKEIENTNISTPSTLSNYYVVVDSNNKLPTLISFLETQGFTNKYMLFLSTCACVDYFTKILKVLLPKCKIFCIHGKMKEKRYKVFDLFRKAEFGLLLCTDVMARGIDFPEVDWVIQYDPPSSAAAFVHRCGRTARIGNYGSALVMLMPNEEVYVDFIHRNQSVILSEFSQIKKLNEKRRKGIYGTVKKLQLEDRDTFDKANRAFVSYVQFYNKHECNVILRVKDLDLGKLANGFGLLKLPKMPEIKGRNISNFTAENIDFNSIKYKNKQREESRQGKLQLFQETGHWPGTKKKHRKKANAPWAESKLRKESRLEKKKLRKEKSKQKEAEGKLKNKRKRNAFNEEEFEELARDIALMKKLKKKKISEKEFEEVFVTK